MTTHRRRSAAALSAAVVLAAVIMLPAPTAAVAATDYPSWTDVERARQNESAKQSEVSNLEQALTALSVEVQRTEEAAATAETEYQDAYALAAQTEEELNVLANALTEALTAARTSSVAAGTFVQSLSRTGLSSPSLLALAEPGGTDEMLFQLGALSRLGDQADGALATAQQDANTVDALRAQADLAGHELERRRAAAEVIFQEAETAFADTQRALRTSRRRRRPCAINSTSSPR